jgi:hypothetical protein
MGVTHSTIVKTDNYARVMATAKDLNGGFVKVGFPEKAEPAGWLHALKTGAKPYENMSEVARIAAWNEFGVPKKGAAESGAKRGFMSFWRIPPRPFFRPAWDNNLEALKSLCVKVESKCLRGAMVKSSFGGTSQFTPDMAFEALGLWMQAKIRAAIMAVTTPVNAPITIERKGSSKPLVDTGQMLNSVNFVRGGK